MATRKPRSLHSRLSNAQQLLQDLRAQQLLQDLRSGQTVAFRFLETEIVKAAQEAGLSSFRLSSFATGSQNMNDSKANKQQREIFGRLHYSITSLERLKELDVHNDSPVRSLFMVAHSAFHAGLALGYLKRNLPPQGRPPKVFPGDKTRVEYIKEALHLWDSKNPNKAHGRVKFIHNHLTIYGIELSEHTVRNDLKKIKA